MPSNFKVQVRTMRETLTATFDTPEEADMYYQQRVQTEVGIHLKFATCCIFSIHLYDGRKLWKEFMLQQDVKPQPPVRDMQPERMS